MHNPHKFVQASIKSLEKLNHPSSYFRNVFPTQDNDGLMRIYPRTIYTPSPLKKHLPTQEKGNDGLPWKSLPIIRIIKNLPTQKNFPPRPLKENLPEHKQNDYQHNSWYFVNLLKFYKNQSFLPSQVKFSKQQTFIWLCSSCSSGSPQKNFTHPF